MSHPPTSYVFSDRIPNRDPLNDVLSSMDVCRINSIDAIFGAVLRPILVFMSADEHRTLSEALRVPSAVHSIRLCVTAVGAASRCVEGNVFFLKRALPLT